MREVDLDEFYEKKGYYCSTESGSDHSTHIYQNGYEEVSYDRDEGTTTTTYWLKDF